MVNTPPLYTPLNPVGRPVTPAPVPPPDTEYVILVIAELTQRVWTFVPAPDVNAMTAFGLTVIVPVADVWVQVPVVVTVKLNVPVTDGVPLMVNTPPLYTPLNPVGKPVTPAPVPPPVTEYVILVIAVLIQRDWTFVPAPDVNAMTAFGLTTCVLLADVVPHDPPLVVSVNVAVPLYPAGGVHVAFNVVAFGLKVPPAGVDHVPPVAEPPTLPPNGAEVPPWHIALRADPAFTVGNGIIVTRTDVLVLLTHPVVVFLAIA
jgi:hypothetical protein